jgi:ADP-ribose pyrophosphatase YjhB (NUDIX family)
MRPIPNRETLLSIADPRLRSNPDLATARGALRAYSPATAGQVLLRQRVINFIEAHPQDAHLRSCRPGHLTASALVLDSRGERALLTHHRKLNRWLQLGGHCDGDGNLPRVALKESLEEGGIEDLRIAPEIIDLDIHSIPARPGEPEHLHLDCRFLVLAPEGAEPVASEESYAVRWWPLREIARLGVDDSVLRLVRLVGPS